MPYDSTARKELTAKEKPQAVYRIKMILVSSVLLD